MKRLILVLAAVSALFVAPTASAAMPIEYKTIPPDPSQPSPTLCVAYSNAGQSCRRCYQNLKPDGSVLSNVCKAVTAASFCGCRYENNGFTGCTSEGECLYR